MIDVKSLVKLYGERQVLHGLDFSVGVGRVCGLLGPNGSGKSTTMDILAGLLGPSDGEVTICGHNVVTDTREAKRYIGYLPDNAPLYREMRVHEFVDYVAKLHGLHGNEKKSAMERVMADCDVTDVADRIIGNLSKGYRQRVALCGALVHNPKVLILDEPTEGLDPNQIVHIRNLIKKLAADRTVIMSSHILSEVEATCDDVIVINQGRIVAKTTITGNVTANQQEILYSFTGPTTSAMSFFSKHADVEKVVGYGMKNNSLVVTLKSQGDTDISKKVAALNGAAIKEGLEVVGVQEHTTALEALYFNVIKTENAKVEL